MTTPDELELLGHFSRLRSALASDCLDRCGVRNNAMASRLRPVFPGARLAGYAFTVEVVPVDSVPEDEAEWYRGELHAVDSLRDGDVLVVSRCPDGPFFGELLATAARRRGARGAVIDAATRDTAQIARMGFATFASSVNPLDSLGRMDVTAVNIPVLCGDVRVEARDLVLADDDGVVVVPRALAEEVAVLAEEKAAGEDVMREALEAGMGLWEAFHTYGVI